jgi:hypothetical protein
MKRTAGALALGALLGVVALGAFLFQGRPIVRRVPAQTPSPDAAQLDRIEKLLDKVRGDVEELAREVDGQNDEMKRLTRSMGEHGQHLAELKSYLDVALRRLQPDGGGPDPAQSPEALKGKLREKGVILDEKAQTVTVSGMAHLQRGPIELVACAPGGRMHETLFVLECEPSSLNAAFVALGLEPGQAARYEEGGKVVPPKGTPVYLTIEWEKDGKPVRHRVEDLILNRRTEQPMQRGGWVYIGSRMDSHHQTGKSFFVADVTRDLVTTLFDSNTILDNPLPEGGDDSLFFAHPERMPPRGTKVKAIFSLKETP